MHKYAIAVLFSSSCVCLYASALKILHLSFHSGCIKDFEYVGQQLHLDLTSWHVSGSERVQFDSIDQVGNDIMNIGPIKAQRIWDLNKDYFNQFDVIITSDTAPLARIFLQNGWSKPLIIWVCNRFDYHDDGYNPEKFPDKAYYQMFADAMNRKNVMIVGYTEFEHFYAHERGVHIGTRIIKPCGIVRQPTHFVSTIPSHIDKPHTFFIPPREGAGYLKGQCIKLDIPVYTGLYNGPYDLKDFKGVIHWPYQWSNFALFENMQSGLIHFVPSAQLVRYWFWQGAQEAIWYPLCSLDLALLELAEWWNSEYRDIIIYFDSWEDLKHKVETADYVAMCKKIKDFGAAHKHEMISRWRTIFNTIKQNISI